MSVARMRVIIVWKYKNKTKSLLEDSYISYKRLCRIKMKFSMLVMNSEGFTCASHLSDLFEGLRIHICKNIALRKRKDLEGHSTVMVLQRRYVIVAHCQLCVGIDLVPGRWMTRVNGWIDSIFP